jgi:hypothetical protein
LYISI